MAYRKIMKIRILLLVLCSLLIWHSGLSQLPQPCGQNPIMANNCADACVLCDINGYTGTNNLEAGGQAVNGFCSTPNDMHFIAFVAGSVSLSIRIDVFNCFNPNSSFWKSLDLGLFESTNCSDFNPISVCREDLENGDFFIFETTEPLTIGQHYYLIMDGSFGSICNWSFSVLEGSTVVDPLIESNQIDYEPLICANQLTTFSMTPQVGATIIRWTIDDVFVHFGEEFDYTFTQSGTYNICFEERNSCNNAPQHCESIFVSPQILYDTTIVICEGDIIEYNGIIYEEAGIYTDLLISADSGCDTVASLTLDYGAVFEGDDQYFICEGDTLFINDQIHFEQGVYDHLLVSDKGCDSIVHVSLDLVICNMQGISDGVDLLCNGDGATGAVTFSITDGTPPFTYEYVKVLDEDIVNGSSTLSSDFEDVTINNLPAGSYLITVNDAFGNFTIITEDIAEPDQLNSAIITSDFNGFAIDCNGTSNASVSVTANGGVPAYSYLWSQDELTTSVIDNIPSGPLYVTITDANECQHLDTVIITQPTPVIVQATSINPNCDGPNTGSISINSASGGIPDYTYSFDNDIFSNQLNFTNLNEGVYHIQAKDANGCIDSLEVNLIAAEVPQVSFQEDLTVTLGDTISIDPIINDITIQSTIWTPADYLDSDSALSPFAFPTNSTSYSLQVTSEDGCTDEQAVNIYVNKDRAIFSANIFSPIAFGEDAKFSILGGQQILQVLSLDIFDRWGNLIYSGSGLPPNSTEQGWDGTFNGTLVEPGVFVWRATVEYLDGFIQEHTGTITLIK